LGRPKVRLFSPLFQTTFKIKMLAILPCMTRATSSSVGGRLVDWQKQSRRYKANQSSWAKNQEVSCQLWLLELPCDNSGTTSAPAEICWIGIQIARDLSQCHRIVLSWEGLAPTREERKHTRQNERERKRDREKKRKRKRARENGTERTWSREGEREREREKERKKERARERGRVDESLRGREIGRLRERQRESERKRERQREKSTLKLMLFFALTRTHSLPRSLSLSLSSSLSSMLSCTCTHVHALSPSPFFLLSLSLSLLFFSLLSVFISVYPDEWEEWRDIILQWDHTRVDWRRRLCLQWQRLAPTVVAHRLFYGLNPQFVLDQTSPRCLAVVLGLHTVACHQFHPRRRYRRHASACRLGFGYHYHPGQRFCRLEYNTQRDSCRGQLLGEVPFNKLPLLAFKPWSTESILEVQRVFANMLVSLCVSPSLSPSLSLCWSLSLSLPF